MSENIEIWKPVVGYEGLYECSNMGNVRSLNYRHTNIIKNLSLSLNKDGYVQVNLWKNCKGKVLAVHRLVAEAFVPNPNNKPEIDHINTDKTDNTVWLNEDGSVNYEKTNLRWVTKKENMNNPLTIKDLSKIRIGNENAKSIYRAVLQYTKDGKLIKEWASMNSAARELKINKSGIYSCCNGINRTKSYGGYVWRYKK